VTTSANPSTCYAAGNTGVQYRCFKQGRPSTITYNDDNCQSLSYERFDFADTPCVVGSRDDSCLHTFTGSSSRVLCREGTTVADFAAQIEYPAYTQVLYSSEAACNSKSATPSVLRFNYINRCSDGTIIYQCNYDYQNNTFVPSLVRYQGSSCSGASTVKIESCSDKRVAYCINVPVPQYVQVTSFFSNNQCTGDASTISTTIQTGRCNPSTLPTGCSNTTTNGGYYTVSCKYTHQNEPSRVIQQ